MLPSWHVHASIAASCWGRAATAGELSPWRGAGGTRCLRRLYSCHQAAQSLAPSGRYDHAIQRGQGQLSLLRWPQAGCPPGFSSDARKHRCWFKAHLRPGGGGKCGCTRNASCQEQEIAQRGFEGSNQTAYPADKAKDDPGEDSPLQESQQRDFEGAQPNNCTVGSGKDHRCPTHCQHRAHWGSAQGLRVWMRNPVPQVGASNRSQEQKTP